MNLKVERQQQLCHDEEHLSVRQTRRRVSKARQEEQSLQLTSFQCSFVDHMKMAAAKLDHRHEKASRGFDPANAQV